MPRRPTILISALATLVSATALTDPCSAAVRPGRVIDVALGSNIIALAGYPPSSPVRVSVIRDATTIGTATATVLADGSLDINEAGATAVPSDCFTGPLTPDLRPGDVVRTVDEDGGVDDEVARDLSVRLPLATDTAPDSTGTIGVRGTLRTLPTAPVALAFGDTLDVVLVNRNLFAVNGRRQLRADATPLVDPLTGDFAVTFGVTAADARAWALSPGETTVTWAPPPPALNGAVPTTSTTADDEVEAPGCPPVARAGFSTVDAGHGSLAHPIVNRANADMDLAVAGDAPPEASAVELTAGGVTVPAVTASSGDGTGRRRWTGTVAASVLRGLPEGEFTIGATFSGAGAPPAVRLIGIKDTIAPTLEADPAPGLYDDALSVGLSTDAGDLRYTIDGPPPTGASSPYTGRIVLGRGDHVIRVAATDRAGNVTTSELRYRVGLSPVPAGAFAAPAPFPFSVRLTGASRQRSRHGGARLTVSSPRAGTVVARGRLRAGRRSYGVATVTVRLGAPGRRPFTLRLGPTARRATRSALRQRRQVRLAVDVRVTALDRSVATAHRDVRIVP